MKPITTGILAVVGLLITGSVMAVEMSPLAKKHGCIACHTVDRKLVGPAYLDVAKKYQGDQGAFAKLEAKVAMGGAGVWGTMPMPPNAPKVPAADIKELVRWIMSLSDSPRRAKTPPGRPAFGR